MIAALGAVVIAAVAAWTLRRKTGRPIGVFLSVLLSLCGAAAVYLAAFPQRGGRHLNGPIAVVGGLLVFVGGVLLLRALLSSGAVSRRSGSR